MLKAVLFDIDGTLVLSNESHAKSWQDAFAEHGYEVEYEKLFTLIGTGSDKLIAEIDQELSADEGVGKQIKDRRKEIFLSTYVESLEPCPGSRDLVKTVQEAGLKTIVASSASQEELRELLKKARVDDMFDLATTSDDVDNSKPHPDIVHAALEKVGANSDEAYMIGDTPYDIEAARKAGVKCIAVRTGGWDDNSLSGAEAIYDSPADIVAHRKDLGL